MTTTNVAAHAPSGMRLWNRELAAYPEHGTRRLYLLLVVLITVALYYELYVGGGVATLMLPELKIPFPVFVYVLAAGNLLGAFASLLAGLADRFGRANLVVYGLLLVGLITLFWMPNVTTTLEWGIASSAVAFVEGIVLVATPALIRDFSPQVGRATAMGFWTVGPVLGSLAVSAVNTATLPYTHTWQSQFVICGVIGLVIFVLAFLFLRELAPNLRDQVMVSERDRVLVELKAKGLDIEASLRNPWRQMLHLDVIASALGVSTLLLFYYTAVGFGIIYLVTVFQFSVADANALSNWSWGVNALALVVAGVFSDRLRVRKPFMLVGGIGGILTVWLYLIQAGGHPSFATLVLISCAQSVFVGAAYVTWMASFTETVEARNPALTATGLAIWGWLLRLVVTACLAGLPSVVKSVTPLIEAPYVLAAYKQAVAANAQPSAAIVEALGQIKQAAAAAPGEWQTWYWICIGGIVFFVATIFLMRGRWSPAAAKADEEAHDAAVARELDALRRA
jgi:MFS family permease